MGSSTAGLQTSTLTVIILDTRLTFYPTANTTRILLASLKLSEFRFDSHQDVFRSLVRLHFLTLPIWPVLRQEVCAGIQVFKLRISSKGILK